MSANNFTSGGGSDTSDTSDDTTDTSDTTDGFDGTDTTDTDTSDTSTGSSSTTELTSGGGEPAEQMDDPQPDDPQLDDPQPDDPQVDDPRPRGPGADPTRGQDPDATVRGQIADRLTQAGNDVDPDITDRLTTGGVFAETAQSSDGLLPGSVRGYDISEAQLQESATAINERADSTFESNEELTVFGSDLPDRVITGAARGAVGVANVPGLVQGAETGVEVATSAPGVVADEGVGDVAETAAGVGAVAASATAKKAANNPAGFAGGAAFNLVAGAGAGRQIGKAGRAARDRTRTAGGTRIDAEDIASDDVVKYVETDGAEGTRFPGADDPDLYKSDPAEAVRRQSDANTPTEIDTTFEDADVEGTTLTKALDTEPDGPDAGRADSGFSSAPGESLDEFDYETPGSFFGPELSPNFLGIDDGAGFSLRPGIPDTGNSPTAVFARTDVENPDADTLDGFNQEMVDRAGETTAVTKPADEVNVGEIEAVVPPGAEFRSVGGGGLFGRTGSRAGIGSEYFTEIGGRRVPLRTVAPGEKRRGRGDGVGDGPDGVVGTTPDSRRRTGTLDELSEPVSQPVDRPVAGFGAGGSSSTAPSSSGGGSGLGGSPIGSGGPGSFGSPGSGGGSGGTTSGTPDSGTGTPGGGSPGGGSPTGGTPTSGTPGGGTPTSGTPGGGTPTSGTPTSGTPTGGTGTPIGGGGPTPPPTTPGGQLDGGDDEEEEFEFAAIDEEFTSPTQSLTEVDDALSDDLGGTDGP